jgi:hypothetical protein
MRQIDLDSSRQSPEIGCALIAAEDSTALNANSSDIAKLPVTCVTQGTVCRLPQVVRGQLVIPFRIIFTIWRAIAARGDEAMLVEPLNGVLVMAGHSRSKNGVAFARLCPAIHVFLA